LLGLSRASGYRGEPLAQNDANNLMLMRLIDEKDTCHPCSSSRKLAYRLRQQGFRASRQRVRRLGLPSFPTAGAQNVLLLAPQEFPQQKIVSHFL